MLTLGFLQTARWHQIFLRFFFFQQVFQPREFLPAGLSGGSWPMLQDGPEFAGCTGQETTCCCCSGLDLWTWCLSDVSSVRPSPVSVGAPPCSWTCRRVICLGTDSQGRRSGGPPGMQGCVCVFHSVFSCVCFCLYVCMCVDVFWGLPPQTLRHPVLFLFSFPAHQHLTNCKSLSLTFHPLHLSEVIDYVEIAFGPFWFEDFFLPYSSILFISVHELHLQFDANISEYIILNERINFFCWTWEIQSRSLETILEYIRRIFSWN